MCSVDPEGKWRWYLKTEYGAMTMVHLLQLGLSLSAVQTRNALVSRKLAWRRTTRRWATVRSAGAARVRRVARALTTWVRGPSSTSAEVHEDPWEAEAREWDERLQATAAREAAGVCEGGPTTDAHGADRLEDYWEDIRRDSQHADARSTWCTAAVLSRWERRQLLLHYLREQRTRRVARASESASAQSLKTRARPLRSLQSLSAHAIAAVPLVELERELLSQLLNSFDEYLSLTHAEAVDMKLLKLFAQQAAAFREHRAQAGKVTSTDESADRVDGDDDENVFVLSETDASYRTSVMEGRPTAVTYAEAVRLTTLLGEAIAWESYKLHASRQAWLDAMLADDGSVSQAGGGAALTAPSISASDGADATATIAAAATAAAAAETTQRCSEKHVGGVRTAVQADCIALMLPNSVEYNLLWWGISRSGPLKTFLTELYDGPVFTPNIAEDQRRRGREEAALAAKGVLARGALRLKQALRPARSADPTAGVDGEPAIYRPCRTALINTNVTSNAMLYHALSCSSCHVIIMDVRYAPLLFVSAEGGGPLRLNVPPLLQRVFLWRWSGLFTESFTAEMKAQLDALNESAYAHLPEALRRGAGRVHGEGSPYTRPLSTPRGYGGAMHATTVLAEPARAAAAAAAATSVTDVYRGACGEDEEGGEYDEVSSVPESTLSTTPTTPPLDLMDLLRTDDGRARRRRDDDSGPEGGPAAGRFPLLLARMLRHPPRWLHCDPAQWTPRGTPASASLVVRPDPRSATTPDAPALSPSAPSDLAVPPSNGGGRGGRTSVAHMLLAHIYIHSIHTSLRKTRQLAMRASQSPRNGTSGGEGGASTAGLTHTPSGSTTTTSRSALLERTAGLERMLVDQQAAFHARVTAALSRFTHTQPVLLIYTSGTTGLPKAARFSHLRFFATAFLSNVLRFREKTGEVLRARQAARRRFTDALAKAVQQENQRVQGARGQPGAAPQQLTAFCDEDNRHKKGALEATVIVFYQFFSALLALCLWLAGLLEAVRRARHAVGRAWYTVTRRADQWRAWCEEEAAIAEELSRVTIYNTLPMYHTAGCVLCLGHLMHALEEQQAAHGKSGSVGVGIPHRPRRLPTARMVIRTKFSVSKFVDDMQRYHVTVVQYIGEILRYAVHYERDHAPTAAAVKPLLLKELAEVLRGGHQECEDRTRGNTLPMSIDTEADKGEPAGEDVAAVALVEPKDSPALSPGKKPRRVDSLLAERSHLLPAPTSEREVLHLMNLLGRWRVPYAFGNGLRLDIWQESKDRLSYVQPVEFYSSTEGNIFIMNLFDIPGAVGHIPRFPGPLNWLLDMNYFFIFPFRVLRFDEETQQVWRDPRTKYCAIVDVDEPGEIVGEIIEGFDIFALRRFDGYHQEQPADAASVLTAYNAAGGPLAATDEPHAGTAPVVVNVGDVESRKKIIRHVRWPFWKDAYFRSGDLVKFDDSGFITFVDRVGDTFRWKGENVSTLEVSNALSLVHTGTIGVQEAVVYGVPVEGREGRAGMGMLTLQRRFLDTHATGQAQQRGGGQPHRLTLAEERLFMQNDLYPFLCGRRRTYGDGTVAQSALPAYATPPFMRVEDATEDEAEGENLSGEHTGNGTTRGPAGAVGSQEAVRTTTFKYRKAVLAAQGYSVAPPSTIESERVWGGEAEGDDEYQPASRFYVLVTKPDVWRQLSLSLAQESEVPAGYVPLTARAVRLLGDRFEGCGW